LRDSPNQVYNFTTINITSNVTVSFIRNATNTPVTMLAQGDVMIAGNISLNGQTPITLNSGGMGGPGGFNGGAGGFAISGLDSGITGDGPGGGAGGSGGNHGAGGGYAVGGGAGGPSYGTPTLLPLIGGSGGGGGSGNASANGQCGTPGSGGGGAILIASSGTITLNNGGVQAKGAESISNSCNNTYGGAGAGGGIRLVANTIAGNPSLDVRGGEHVGAGGEGGGFGFTRVEAFDLSNFNPSLFPNDPVSFSIAQPKTLINPSQLTIMSVAGINAPATPKGSLAGPPDIVIPTQQTNPVDVLIKAANVPVGTVVQVTVTPQTGARTIVPATLGGTLASSTATAKVTLPTAGLSVISATTTFTVNTAKANPLVIDGERIDRIEVAAVFGGTSSLTYITTSGKRIKKE